MFNFSNVKGIERFAPALRGRFETMVTAHLNSIDKDERIAYEPSSVKYDLKKHQFDVTTKGNMKFNYKDGKWY